MIRTKKELQYLNTIMNKYKIYNKEFSIELRVLLDELIKQNTKQGREEILENIKKIFYKYVKNLNDLEIELKK